MRSRLKDSVAAFEADTAAFNEATAAAEGDEEAEKPAYIFINVLIKLFFIADDSNIIFRLKL